MKPLVNKSLCSLFVLVCVYAPILTFATQVGPGNSQISQAEATPANWKRFVSPEGRFSILFPGIPTVSTETVEAPPWKFVLHKHQVRTFAEYGVIYSDYPKSVTDSTPADTILDQGAKGAVAEVNSQLLSISPISVGGYPGRLLKERMPNGTIMHAKMVLVGQRMYQIAITTPTEDAADAATVGFYNSTATKFLDSFNLIHGVTTDAATQQESPTACPPEVSNCISLTGDRANGRAISLPPPAYPAIARAAHATGTVEVQIVVDEEGNVISAKSISGHPLLQAAAVTAARQAKFTPPLVDNKPVKFAGILQYHFVLN